MTSRHSSGPADPRPEARGSFAAGNTRPEASPVEGDSPTHGTVEGPLAPQPSPADEASEPHSEMRPTESDSRKSDGVAEFKRMEDNAEAGRE
jgi:hypothetical protein